MDINNVTIAELAVETTLNLDDYLEMLYINFDLSVKPETTIEEIPKHLRSDIGILTWAYLPN